MLHTVLRMQSKCTDAKTDVPLFFSMYDIKQIFSLIMNGIAVIFSLFNGSHIEEPRK